MSNEEDKPNKLNLVQRINGENVRNTGEPLIQPGIMINYTWTENVRLSEGEVLSESRTDWDWLYALKKEQQTLNAQLIEMKKNSIRDSLKEVALQSVISVVNKNIDSIVCKTLTKSEYKIVNRVTLQKGTWYAQVEGVSEIIPARGLTPLRVIRNPDVEIGEVYEVTVPAYEIQPPFLLKLITFWQIKPKQIPEKSITAKVLTQESLVRNPLVYLTDPTTGEIYISKRSQLKTDEDVRNRRIIASNYRALCEGLLAETASGGSTRKKEKDKSENGESNGDKVDFAYKSPPEVADKLSKVVKRQEYATKAIAVAVFDHHVRPEGNKKSNVIIVGPTGSGKTEISRQASEVLGVPFSEVKLPAVSSTGFKGTNLATLFEDLQKYKEDPDLERALLFLDEIDKLTERMGSSHGFEGTLQNELIGWVESAKVKVPIGTMTHFEVDTTNMLFIAAGAFVGLEEIIARRMKVNLRSYNESDRSKAIIELYQQIIHDDLVQYGLKPELVGRFPIITFTKPLDTEALIDITKNSAKSAFNQQLQLLQKGYGINVDVQEEVYVMVADAAQSLGTGARGLETVSNKLFEDIKYHISELTAGRTELTITPDIAYDRLKNLLPESYTLK